jgi:rubredoxin
MKYYFKCPNCGNDKQFVKPSEESSGLGFSLFLAGGIFSSLMYAEDKRARIQCTSCAHIFRQPPIPKSPLARFAGWIIALAVTLVVTAAFFFSFPELASLLPTIPVISTIEEAISTQPRVAAYLLVLLFTLIVVSFWLVACVINAKFRKQLSTEYCLKPLTSGELAQHNKPKQEL